MPSVFVVPVYVEVPAGFERTIPTLESLLRRAGYAFHIGEPLLATLEQAKESTIGRKCSEVNGMGEIGAGLSP
jgi:hypothetical protein